MIIGFSTGCLYKTHDALDPATIDLFRRKDCSAIEIMVHRVSDIDKFITLKPSDLQGDVIITSLQYTVDCKLIKPDKNGKSALKKEL